VAREQAPARFEVYHTQLEPTIGSEIRKARPCVVISPDELNAYLHTVIIAPLTSTIHPYPYRVRSRFRGRVGQIALDQLRTVDRQRLGRYLGTVDASTGAEVLRVLQALFSL